jgi:hypothetical protein
MLDTDAVFALLTGMHSHNDEGSRAGSVRLCVPCGSSTAATDVDEAVQRGENGVPTVSIDRTIDDVATTQGTEIVHLSLSGVRRTRTSASSTTWVAAVRSA